MAELDAMSVDAASWWWPGPKPRPRVDARDDQGTTDEDTAVSLNLLANDLGASGIISINGKPVAAGQSVALASGAVVTVGRDGKVSYDPSKSASLNALDAGETGYDSFTYTITGRGGTDTAAVRLTIAGRDDGGGSGNHAPVAVDDQVYVPIGGKPYPGPLPLDQVAAGAPVGPDGPIYTTLALGEEGDPDPLPRKVVINPLANDSDADGDKLTIGTINGQQVGAGDTIKLASGATVTVGADGKTLTYSGGLAGGPVPYDTAGAAAGQTAIKPGPVPYLVDSFSYQASDGQALSGSATVTLVPVVASYDYTLIA